MRFQLRRPIQALDPLLAWQAVSVASMDAFRRALTRLFARIDEHASETHQQAILADFLREAFDDKYHPPFTVGFHEPADLVVRADVVGANGGKTSSVAFIQTRRVFAAEMMTMLKNNVRALHELILYAFDNAQQPQPMRLRQFVVTDAYNWFVFDARDVQTVFLDSARLIRAHQLSQQPGRGAAFFYVEAAKILRDLDQDVPVTYLNLREAAEWLTLPAAMGNERLLPVYQLLSPEHLTGQRPPANDEPAPQRFYDDLLQLLGLVDIHAGRSRSGRSRPGRNSGKVIRLQRRPAAEEQPESLLERTIHQLRLRNVLASMPDRMRYGQHEDEQLAAIGLTLCLTWISRLLIINLLKAQLSDYPPIGKDSYVKSSHSVTSLVHTFGDLNELFFDVIPVPFHQRTPERQHQYGLFPALPCALFDPTDLERYTITIADLTGSAAEPAHLSVLSSLLALVDAYAFESMAYPAVRIDDRPRLTTTDLGQVLDRFVGGLVGAAPVPPVVTNWMVRQAIRSAALTRFNAHFGWSCSTIAELTEQVNTVSTAEASAVFNALRIVDPVVGSGSFLLAALNELVVLKAEMGMLTDRRGQPLARYTIKIMGQALLITHESGEPFRYRPPSTGPLPYPPDPENQRIQETLFHAKAGLLTNLFGTDPHPVAVIVTQVRLTLDLLQHLYVNGQVSGRTGRKTDANSSSVPASIPLLPFLPALDTIRLGNPLVSRYGPMFQIDSLRQQATREKFQAMLTQYQADARAYGNDRTDVRRKRIDAFQAFAGQVFQIEQPDYAAIRRLETRLAQSSLTFDFVGQNDRIQRLNDQLTRKQQRFADRMSLFETALDWRFTFPDVLNTDGTYAGFDLVLGSLLRPLPTGIGDHQAVFRQAFPNTVGGSSEPYGLFVELGMQLLRPGGQLSFVLPDRWLSAGTGLFLRRWLRTKALEQLVQFTNEPTTSQRTTQATVLRIRNGEATGPVRMARIPLSQSDDQNPDELTSLLDRWATDVLIESLTDTAWTDADRQPANTEPGIHPLRS